MANCLGLFIQNNLIKYAKVSKDGDNTKIENYGIAFYEQDVLKAIDKIIDETFSYKTPISINVLDENYANSEIFSLLNEVDQKKSIKTEFDYLYNQMGKNRLTVEYKSILSQEVKDTDRKNVLYVYVEKGNIAERIQLLSKYNMKSLVPVSLSLPGIQQDNNCMIVNIEDRTEVTTFINGKSMKVDIIDLGMEQILKDIAQRENSISKAYEICKNTTLYTESSQNLQTENNEYLDLIVPTIYKIIDQVKQIISRDENKIEKIYISGTGIVINNIDLYFQENFLDHKCEILTPYFIDKTSLKLNIKDYLEVNSAIALAIQGLDKKNREISFVNKSDFFEELREKLNTNVKIGGQKSTKIKAKSSVDFNIKEINCVRFAYSALVMLTIYIVATMFVHSGIDKKTKEAQGVIDDTVTKRTDINKQMGLINSRAQAYTEILNQLEQASEEASIAYSRKNVIPNLLSQIMFAIPKEAQILSIKNTNEKHITIEAQAEEYQYLGYLKSEIQNRAILINVTATSGTRQTNNMIKVTIEGDLPY